jgi:hypothetical protein
MSWLRNLENERMTEAHQKQGKQEGAARKENNKLRRREA